MDTAPSFSRRLHRVEFRESLPGFVVGLVQAETILLPLRNDAEPTTNVAAIGAFRLARRKLLELSCENLERQFVRGTMRPISV